MAPGTPDRHALAALQLERLQRLLRTVRPANPFYEAKLSAAGAPATVSSLGEFTESFPLTTRAEITADQAAHPPYGRNLSYPLDRYTRFHQTSGTTRQPLRWLDDPASWEALGASWIDVFRAAGVSRGDRVLFAFTFGPFLGFWMAFEAAERLGCLCLPGGGLSSVARLRLLLENDATVLCCTPTYAMRLAEVAAQEHIDLHDSRVRSILVAGEPGGSIPAVRERLSRLWNGARVFDHHGMTEVGPVTYECPAIAGRLHVLEDAYLAEVIEPATGRPVGSDSEGELVLTPLGRLGMPLLRYRTGDLVRPLHPPHSLDTSPCPCGRSELVLLGGILGRVDDMIVVRGVNVFPAAVEAVLQRCGGVSEYQVEIFSEGPRNELTLRFEALPGEADVAGLAQTLQKALHDALSLRIPVTPVPPGSLPRSEMKARRWVRR